MDFKLTWSKVSVGLWESPFGLLFFILVTGFMQFPSSPNLSQLQLLLDRFPNAALQYYKKIIWHIFFYFSHPWPQPTSCLGQGWRHAYLFGQRLKVMGSVVAEDCILTWPSFLTGCFGPNKVTSEVLHCNPFCEAAAGGIPRKNLQLGSSGSMQTNRVLWSKYCGVTVALQFDCTRPENHGFIYFVGPVQWFQVFQQYLPLS